MSDKYLALHYLLALFSTSKTLHDLSYLIIIYPQCTSSRRTNISQHGSGTG